MGSSFVGVPENVTGLPQPPLMFKQPKHEPMDELPLPPPPPPPPPPGFNADEPTTPSSTLSHSSTDADVCSEFYRISEMFRTAFTECLQKNGDATVFSESEPNSQAIVPFSNSENTGITPAGSGKYNGRSSQLVRVTDLKPEDQRYFRDLIRKTRMLYDSLRVFAASEEEKLKNANMFANRRSRADLKAAALMRHSGLWLNRDKRIVGDIPGIHIGDAFLYRVELCVVGLHGAPQAGIDYLPANLSSNGEPIATSIIVSGGYEDDEDGGDVIIYTGQGGQDKHGRQVVHQKLESGNLALERSMNYGVEIRVIRGIKRGMGKVYVYDGLYRIIDTWFDVGKSGFGVFKFKLVRIENQGEMGSTILKFSERLRDHPLKVRPTGYVSLDLSRAKEKLPILFYNDIDADHDPLHHEYISSASFPTFVYNNGSSTGCQCSGVCIDGCFCLMKNGGDVYDMNGILLRGRPLIFECGPHCRCPPTCRNRVAQRGVAHPLEVFRSRETGWGVRSLDLVPAGSFLCEYSGIVLTREQALVTTMNGDRLIHPGRFAKRWKEWGELSKIFSDYLSPTHPSAPPLDFSLDVSIKRNVACYISHSTSPNLMVQLVLHDHNNVCFPRLMLFAMENIPPMRELSLDYGIADEVTGKLAICN